MSSAGEVREARKHSGSGRTWRACGQQPYIFQPDPPTRESRLRANCAAGGLNISDLCWFVGICILSFLNQLRVKIEHVQCCGLWIRCPI